VRGDTDFSAAQLRSQLRPWSAESVAAVPPELEAYRRFYGFTLDTDHLIGTVESAGQNIVVQAFLPQKPLATAFVVHGYYDHVGLFVYLIEYLLSRNIAVMGCDLPGHGLSSGDRVTIDSFDTYVQVVREVTAAMRGVLPEQLSGPLHLIGQSMGGSIAMELVEQNGAEDYASVTLLAPLIYPWNWNLNRWVYRIARIFVQTRPRGRSNPTDRADFRKLREVDPLQAAILPVSWVTAMVRWASRFERYPERKAFAPLIVQGHNDRVVDWPFNIDLLKRRYSPVLCEIAEATHHLVNESSEIRSLMWRWLDQQLGLKEQL
jgi:alpha-beta hydrolase superfamily lysophospholipase